MDKKQKEALRECLCEASNNLILTFNALRTYVLVAEKNDVPDWQLEEIKTEVSNLLHLDEFLKKRIDAFNG